MITSKQRAELRRVHCDDVLRVCAALEARRNLSDGEAKFAAIVLRNYVAKLEPLTPQRRRGQAAHVDWFAIAEAFALRLGAGISEPQARAELEDSFRVSRTTIDRAIREFPGLVAFGRMAKNTK